MTPICEVLGAVTANSAFHGTRLDVEHIAQVMEDLVVQAEARGERARARSRPRRCSSRTRPTPRPAAEARPRRSTRCGASSARSPTRCVIANTKGFTGHPMGVGIEDVVAVKALETGVVPPVPNFREVDPELGTLNLSQGGVYPIRYALRLAAGFGSQISMTLLRWTPVRDGRRRNPEELGFAYRVAEEEAWKGWLRAISGQDAPELEVVQHRLRVVDRGAGAAPAAPAEPPLAAVPLGAPTTADVAAAPARQVAGPAPPPAPEPAAAAAVAEPEAQPAPSGGVLDRVLALVSEQTGYPADMLDPELDLEADLGIDTVKQAEVFATIREVYGIPRDDSLKLRDYPTLNDVVAFVEERSPAAAAAEPVAAPALGAAGPTAAPAAAEPAGASSRDGVLDRVLTVVAEQTGYPADMLDPELDLEADLGIDTVKQAEVFATIREVYGIPRDDSLKLRDYPTLNDVVAFVEERSPAAAAAEPVAAPALGAAGPTAAPAAAEPAGASSRDGVLDRVLTVVAEQTGYPADMLDPELDLEADLGIDTVKQAEVFATIREVYGIPRDDSLKLRDYPTLERRGGVRARSARSGRRSRRRSRPRRRAAAGAPRRPLRCRCARLPPPGPGPGAAPAAGPLRSHGRRDRGRRAPGRRRRRGRRRGGPAGGVERAWGGGPGLGRSAGPAERRAAGRRLARGRPSDRRVLAGRPRRRGPAIAARPRGPARGAAPAREAAGQHDARPVAGRLPRLSDPPRRPSRLRRGRSDVRPGRRRDRLHQGAGARARGRTGQGGRFCASG